MADKTDIINVAMRLVGAARITSLDDGSNEANIANDVYDEALDDLLRAHNWNFATRRAKLARLDGAPAFGFNYAYGAPDDWIRTVSAHDNDGGAGSLTIREEQHNGVRAILANTEAVYLRYVARVTDTGLMASDFRRALAFRLAMDFAVPLANSATVAQGLSGGFARALMAARSTDARGASPEMRQPGSWITTRSSWGGSSFAD